MNAYCSVTLALRLGPSWWSLPCAVSLPGAIKDTPLPRTLAFIKKCEHAPYMRVHAHTHGYRKIVQNSQSALKHDENKKHDEHREK